MPRRCKSVSPFRFFNSSPEVIRISVVRFYVFRSSPTRSENIRDQVRTFSCSKARTSATTILDPRAESISTNIPLAPEKASGYAEQLTWNLSESRHASPV